MFGSIRRWLRASLAAGALGVVAACSGGAEPVAERAASAVQAVDDAGDTVRLAAPARRIVSLVPSATETLLALGAGDRLLARTDYDAAPELASLPSVGGGLDPSLEALLALRPEIVVGWKSGGADAVGARLRALGIPFFAVDTQDTTDVFRTIERLGALTGRGAAADSLGGAIRAELAAVRASVAGRPERTAFYVVSEDPPMTAGARTFVGQLIGAAGGRSVFPEIERGWPQVSLEELVRRRPEVLLVPVGADEARASALGERPGWSEVGAEVRPLPADLLNRPGPRIGAAARALRDALHPEVAGE